jgi:hypothetical protein
MIIFETLIVLRKLKQNNEEISEVYKFLLILEVYKDLIFHDKALKDTLTNNIWFFDNLGSMCNNIQEIVSFDKNFEMFNDIKRIY